MLDELQTIQKIIEEKIQDKDCKKYKVNFYKILGLIQQAQHKYNMIFEGWIKEIKERATEKIALDLVCEALADEQKVVVDELKEYYKTTAKNKQQADLDNILNKCKEITGNDDINSQSFLIAGIALLSGLFNTKEDK